MKKIINSIIILQKKKKKKKNIFNVKAGVELMSTSNTVFFSISRTVTLKLLKDSICFRLLFAFFFVFPNS